MDTLSFDSLERETQIKHGETMLCKLESDNVISYVNDYFLSFSEYAIEDVLGKTALDIKYPDFPVTIFNHIMQYVFLQKNIHILINDQTASGKNYWYLTNYYFKTDTKGQLLNVYSYRQPAPAFISPDIIELYDKLLKMEQYASLKVAQNYFEGFLEEKKMSFEEYTNKLLSQHSYKDSSKNDVDDFFMKNTTKKKKGIFTNLFGGK